MNMPLISNSFLGIMVHNNVIFFYFTKTLIFVSGFCFMGCFEHCEWVNSNSFLHFFIFFSTFWTCAHWPFSGVFCVLENCWMETEGVFTSSLCALHYSFKSLSIDINILWASLKMKELGGLVKFNKYIEK